MALSDDDQTYTKMIEADVGAVGRHCEQSFCHQLDFLPFRCESCKGQFCLDHRTEDAHQCPQKGAWARRKREQAGLAFPSSQSTSKPSIHASDVKQCSDPSCKTILDTLTEPRGTVCETCHREYCLKHRQKWDHSCEKLTPLGLGQGGKTPGLSDALGRLRAWGAAKKAATSSAAASKGPFPLQQARQSTVKPFTSSLKKWQSASRSSAAASVASLVELKKSARGPPGIADDKKIYLHIEAEAFHTSADDKPGVEAKIPRMNVFLNKEWSVGRALDEAAKLLQVQNRNNQTDDEKDRLRVFAIEEGRLLEFHEKLNRCIKNGCTLVLLRGIGPAVT